MARLLADVTTDSETKVYLLEEPTLHDADMPYLRLDIPDAGGIVGVRTARYQQSSDYRDVVAEWHKEVGFDAVMPGREYGVIAAFEIAGTLGLPRPSALAIDACTDKLTLREMCARAGIRQPAFAEVSSAQEVRNFVAAVGGEVILKPANRHASLGVVELSGAHQAETAWRRTTQHQGPRAVKDRSLSWRYMAEERLTGPQVSVETLVQDGRAIFHNVSLMEFSAEFLEIGNVVPAPLSPECHRELIDAEERFLEAINADLGIFHSEWKLSPDGPRIIECAARLPGILRSEQIWWTQGFNLPLAFARLLSGQSVDPVPTGAASRFSFVGTIYAEAGVVTSVTGLEFLDELPQVVKYEVKVHVGQRIKPDHNPWNYCVRYVLVDPLVKNITRVREFLDSHIRVVTDPSVDAEADNAELL
ncbi:ATP-grasp domain-containing protein [Kutzneria sp. CA-103260]|uniref:ATP-grasp domain-containing protein n=1 Tax=Kutzneria sp. CA-103260 TaxID=2802641 RepID=UPI001BA6C8B1|nr:ATP-grasp domain-containing protein [Kutzneria sp. CA-103260]